MPVVKVVPHKNLPNWETVYYADGASINRPIQPIPFRKTTLGCWVYWLCFFAVGILIAFVGLRYLAGMMF